MKQSSGRWLWVAAWLGAYGIALAQTPADIEAARRQSEVLQRQEQERLRQDIERAQPPERQPQGIDTRSLVPKPDASAAGAGCHTIREIVINGAPRLPDSVRAELKARFVDRCLGVSEIEEILGEITKAYILRGYVTARAYLPAQNLASGRLEIMVVEGEVSSILIEDGGKGSVSKGNAFPLAEGRVLNLRDLEQGIDQINRLSSNNARLDIQPGEKAGESVIVIRNEPRFPLHFSLSYDNQGAPATGRHQTGATLSYDSPLGFNDFVTFTHRESTPGDEQSKFAGSDSLTYSIPFGYSTVTLGWSESKYASTIALPSGLELVSSGNTTSSYARLDRVVFRDQTNRANVAATLTTKDSKNYLNDQFLQVGSRKLTVLDVDGSLSTRVLGGALTMDIGVAQGLDALDALQDADNLPDSAPRAQYRKYKFGLNYMYPFALFNQDAMFTSQLAGQYAEDVLYGSEQMLIGSLYSVRGFVRNTLSGDHGYYWRNELSTRVPVRIGSATLAGRVFVAFDLGEVSSRAPGVPQGMLTGMAVGASVSWMGASWDLFQTRPLSGPSWMTLEAPQTWFRVSFSM
jgi:hemolysin activation/secretion protein